MRNKKINKVLVGTVISDKMSKVATVQIEMRKKHPIYKKFVTSNKKVKARNLENKAAIGDKVKMIETRHTSKDVFWKITEILEKVQKG